MTRPMATRTSSQGPAGVLVNARSVASMPLALWALAVTAAISRNSPAAPNTMPRAIPPNRPRT